MSEVMVYVTHVLSMVVSMLLFYALYVLWISPHMVLWRLRKNGFRGPIPKFPFGNLDEMMYGNSAKDVQDGISHDIHAKAVPYFAKWRESHGKVFVYWIGTEPFLYVGDPLFLKQVTSGSLCNAWGKPDLFKHDRKPMFGNGLLLVEAEEWIHHRGVAEPAFSKPNLNAMLKVMVDSASKLVNDWTSRLASGPQEINVDVRLSVAAAEIIALTTFGVDPQYCTELREKMLYIHTLLFKTKRLIGVPLISNLLIGLRKVDAIGREVDELLLSIIKMRREERPAVAGQHADLLGFLIAANAQSTGKKLSDKDVMDECKTFFFAGHDTTGLAVSWTLFLLAMYPEWQCRLRDEIGEVCGDEPLDPDKLASLVKMGWVFDESIRLYPTAPNVQRQAREDIHVGDEIIPKGTNMWVDTVGMNHDPDWWGADVNEFKPERFENDPKGGCKLRDAFSPFGRGKRMCIGRKLGMMEYKVLLALILKNFSFSISPKYRHHPQVLLTLRPSHGMPLIVSPLNDV